jgi:HD-GYP domain-containing protein (c-di-GMP phosphodiesterase class II)
MSLKDWFGGKKKPTTLKRVENTDYSSLEKVYTPVNQLALGMYVVELDRPWLETNFAIQGFELTSESQIQSVKNVCEYVYIDMSRKRRRKEIERGNTSVTGAKHKLESHKVLELGAPPRKLASVEKEMGRAEQTYENTQVLVKEFLNKASKGDGVDGWLAKQAVAECVNSVLQSPDALLWLSQLKHKDHYTAQHSLNTCILSIVLGRHLNLPEKNLNNLGLCGMMHDIGNSQIPLAILNKPGKLTPDEVQIMQSHTTLGYELLKSSNDMHLSAISVALTHHEQLDGKGYPRGIDRASISDFSKIVSIADVYDAITSNRVYQNSKTHLEAITTLTKVSGTQLDTLLVVKFIESLGVYPPGCFVEMTNGSVAIVIEVNETAKLRPKVIMVLDEEKHPVVEQMLDLSEMPLDRYDMPYTIRSIVKPDEWNIDINKFYQENFLQKAFAIKKKR